MNGSPARPSLALAEHVHVVKKNREHPPTKPPPLAARVSFIVFFVTASSLLQSRVSWSAIPTSCWLSPVEPRSRSRAASAFRSLTSSRSRTTAAYTSPKLTRSLPLPLSSLNLYPHGPRGIGGCAAGCGVGYELSWLRPNRLAATSHGGQPELPRGRPLSSGALHVVRTRPDGAVPSRRLARCAVRARAAVLPADPQLVGGPPAVPGYGTPLG